MQMAMGFPSKKAVYFMLFDTFLTMVVVFRTSEATAKVIHNI